MGEAPVPGEIMAKGSQDNALVASLVSAAREGGDDADPVVRWLRDGSGNLDGVLKGRALAAVEAAVAMGNGAALAALKANAKDKDVRKAAGAAMHRLKAAGQQVAEVRAPAQWSLGKEEAPVLPPVSFLSPPDADGCFSFLLIATGDNETVAFGGLAGGASGFRDVDHTHLSRSSRRNLLDDARRDPGIVEVPFFAALHYLEKGFAMSGTTPHEWEHLLIHVDEGVRTSARLLDPLGQAPAAPHPDVLAQVVPLLDGPHALLLIPDQDVVTTGMVEVLGAKVSPIEISEEARQQRVSDALDGAANAAVSGYKRPVWALAMEVLAYLSQTAGWEDLGEPARHTALALRSGWEGKDVPYVRELIDRLVQMQTKHMDNMAAEQAER